MKFKKGPILRASFFFLFIMIWPFFVGPIFGPLIPVETSLPVRLIITHILMFILPAIAYILITKQSFKKVLKLNKIGGLDILVAIGIGIIAQPVMAFFAYISSFFFTNDVAGMMNDLNTTPLWIMIVMMGVTPSISEEITMRGIVLSGYDFKNKHIAALMSGLVFGIIHMNPHQFMYAFAMGVIFGYMVRAANSIYVAMIAHFVVNTSQLLLQRMLTSMMEMMGESTIIDPSAAMQELNSLPLMAKLTTGLFYGVIALVGFFIISKLIKVFENTRRKRVRAELEKNMTGDYVRLDDIESLMEPSFGINVTREFNLSKEEIKNEKAVNIPFIIACIIFIYSMVSMVF
ncbi:CPBP family intramembrane glutamic endopeptidase [uncultured Clostridium sp.]|uniref:CPBP family intramembrane glutamic endopeptidase n=1 Tax=uncultured Clostridium sp. TaxID=59620 RepID=UPI002626DEC6|nr:type II CAAX endopeptidase family protein [uncultured Clostridium sp.]